MGLRAVTPDQLLSRTGCSIACVLALSAACSTAGCYQSYAIGSEDAGSSDPVPDIDVEVTGPSTWVRTLGRAGDDWSTSIVEASGGGYVVTGFAQHPGEEGAHVWAFKLDGWGTLVWSWTYEHSSYHRDWLHFIEATTDGGHIIGGDTDRYGAGRWDTLLLRLDAGGDVVWQKAYGTWRVEYGGRAFETGDGGFVTNGMTESDEGDRDLLVLKVDASGDLLWQTSCGGPGDDYMIAFDQTLDGGFISAGSTSWVHPGLRGMWVVKLTGGGEVEWQRLIAGDWDIVALAVQQAADGGYVVLGTTGMTGAADTCLVKLDHAGDVEWQNIYEAPGHQRAFSIRSASGGGYVLCGWSDPEASGRHDAWIMRLDTGGEVMWRRTYGGPGHDTCDALVNTLDGGFAAVGNTDSFGDGLADIWVLKLDGSGMVHGRCPEGFGVDEHVTVVESFMAVEIVSEVCGGPGAMTTDVPGRAYEHPPSVGEPCSR